MKVLVVGANGKIGKQIIQLLGQSPEHEAVAMIRNAEQAPALEKLGAETVIANLEGDVNGVTDGCDAVIFSAGSGGHTGADKTLLIDLDGAFKMVDESERTNIQRFIMISSFFADDPSKGGEKIKYYTVAKHRADERVLNSNLNYTIMRPGILIDEPGTGNIQVGQDLDFTPEQRMIPREDVARTAVAALTTETTFKKVFKMLAGQTPITEALRKL